MRRANERHPGDLVGDYAADREGFQPSPECKPILLMGTVLLEILALALILKVKFGYSPIGGADDF